MKINVFNTMLVSLLIAITVKQVSYKLCGGGVLFGFFFDLVRYYNFAGMDK